MIKKTLKNRKPLGKRKTSGKNKLGKSALRKNVGERFADLVEEYVKEQHRLGQGPEEISKLLSTRYPGFDIEADWVNIWVPTQP